MKKLILAVAMLVCISMESNVNADLIISEVVDGNRIASDGSAGSSPDPFLTFMELTNAGAASISLDGFHYINFNNGASTVGFGSTALTGTLDAGETYYIAYEAGPTVASAFDVTYGNSANEYTGSKFINGDDTLLLLNAEYVAGSTLDMGTVVDLYGVVGVDGSGEDWEYLDTVAQRNLGITSGTSTFDITQWTVQPTNLFDGEDAAFHASNTTVSFTAIPEPSSLAILCLAGLGLGFVRRRK